MTTESHLTEEFYKIFGNERESCHIYFAPGRVNLIGEHTDYNGGHVFPCALDIGTYGVVRKRQDRKLRFYSLNFTDMGMVESDLDDMKPSSEAGWTNYPKGMIASFTDQGMKPEVGFDLLLWGNIPNSSGLSSSASVEVLVGTILRDEYGFLVSHQEIALLGQRCENKFVGVQCGIMDQFAVAMGCENKAIYLDTNTLNYKYVPLTLTGMKIVIACSNKKRGLADSKYNERRQECETALAQLQKKIKIDTLGELSEDEFDKIQNVITDEICRKRARHAVYENCRTKRAVEVLQNGNTKEFGRLMNESHVSLRDDYEVTGKELDTLAEAAWSVPGVIGSRMTGAGFGGCTVSIVTEGAVEDFIASVGQAYKVTIGYAADFYVVNIGGGPRRVM